MNFEKMLLDNINAGTVYGTIEKHRLVGVNMVYSDVVNGGLILPRAARYTIRHYKRLRRQGFSIARARFICHCSAIYHATDISKTLCNSIEWFTIAEYNGII